MSTLYIEKRVEVDTVAAGSHMETKRGIDYTQIYVIEQYLIIMGAVDELCSHHLLIPRPKSKTLTYLKWNR
jgi:hypothetical protein